MSQITLLSETDSFHTSLLAKFLEAQLGLGCKQLSCSDFSPQKSSLCLLDCANASLETLHHCLRELSVDANANPTALINAEHNEDHEDLLDWPCTSGLFYIDTTEDQLLRGIKQLLDGDYWVPRRLLHHFLNKHRKAQNKSGVVPISSIQLTNREKEILRMIKDGMSNSDVSASLELSEHTVKSHLYNLYKKIGVRNRMEAGNWARNRQDLDTM